MKSLAIILVLTTLGSIGACGRKADPTAPYLAACAASQVQAEAAMLADLRAGSIGFGALLDAAHDHLDTAAPTIEFPESVLRVLQAFEDGLPSEPEYELLWYRIGALAFRTADLAANQGDFQRALTISLSGPARWQTENYWMRFSGHDALVSICMAQTGDRAGAIRRLKNRAVLGTPGEAALQWLESQ